MSESTHATSAGETGGLPGANAAPVTAEVADDETAPTTLAGGPATPEQERREEERG
ncbi:hypothetical protein [Motilibacter rhizosphaerae]|nr:hypothetical protein [Motilibacter rhizosphaerae]